MRRADFRRFAEVCFFVAVLFVQVLSVLALPLLAMLCLTRFFSGVAYEAGL